MASWFQDDDAAHDRHAEQRCDAGIAHDEAQTRPLRQFGPCVIESLALLTKLLKSARIVHSSSSMARPSRTDRSMLCLAESRIDL